MKHALSTGDRYGRLVITSVNREGKRRDWAVTCLCDCGQIKHTHARNLLEKGTRSCGCLLRDSTGSRFRKHGHSTNFRASDTYVCWQNMRARCEKPQNAAYARYGGRGITVCDRWRIFQNFLADMGERPAGLTLERKNNDLGYSPENCCWSTRKQQQGNRCNSIQVTALGKTQCLAHWADELGINRGTLNTRIKRGWTPERALQLV